MKPSVSETEQTTALHDASASDAEAMVKEIERLKRELEIALMRAEYASAVLARREKQYQKLLWRYIHQQSGDDERRETKVDQFTTKDWQSYARRLEFVNTRLRRRLDAAIRVIDASSDAQKLMYEELREARELRKLNEELQQQLDETRQQLQLLERELLAARGS